MYKKLKRKELKIESVCFLCFISYFRMGKSSKKGRLTGGQRKEINDRLVTSVLDDDLEGAVFGRVVKHLGASHILVLLENKREAIARIRNILARRGSTPIVTDDIVILSPRDFETAKDTKPRFDVLAITSRHQAARLEKDGKIPAWMLQSSADMEDGGEDLFDYLSAPAEGREDSDDDEVDVDKI